MHARDASRAGRTSRPCRRARSVTPISPAVPPRPSSARAARRAAPTQRGRHVRAAPRPLSRLRARHLRALPPAGRRPPSVPLPAAAARRCDPTPRSSTCARGSARRSAPSGEWFAGRGRARRRAPASRACARASRRRATPCCSPGPTAGFVAALRRRLVVPARSRQPAHGHRRPEGHATRPLSRAGFLRACWTHLGIAGYFCVNEYGMTELCSQRYDERAARSLRRPQPRAPPARRAAVAAHARARSRHPRRPSTPAPSGLLCHHDLANAGSVSVVLTEDLGRTVGDDGIEVVGRVPGAPPRGCGLLLADLVP